jgi:hypothetical protein
MGQHVAVRLRQHVPVDALAAREESVVLSELAGVPSAACLLQNAQR